MTAAAVLPFLAATLLLSLGALPAQHQATTLASLARSAPVVVVATAVAATDPSPEFHRVAFRTETVLRGPAPGTFELLEPAGRCCGRSLFALEPGTTCLLFLARTGAALHPLGGGRGVLAASPAVTTHVAALLEAADDAARARVLFSGLGSADLRVAADAAHALAALPGLRASAAERAALAAAAEDAVAAANAHAPALLDVAVRLADRGCLDRLLPRYQAERRPDVKSLLRAALARHPADDVLAAVAVRWPKDHDGALATAELLAALPDTAGRNLLQRLAAEHGPRAALVATEALLAAGASATELRGRVPDAVLDLALRRSSAPPRFRSIDPRRKP